LRLQAAKLVTEQGYSYVKAAQRLGTTNRSVRNWVRKFQEIGELPSKEQSQPKITPTGYENMKTAQKSSFQGYNKGG